MSWDPFSVLWHNAMDTHLFEISDGSVYLGPPICFANRIHRRCKCSLSSYSTMDFDFNLQFQSGSFALYPYGFLISIDAFIIFYSSLRRWALFLILFDLFHSDWSYIVRCWCNIVIQCSNVLFGRFWHDILSTSPLVCLQILCWILQFVWWKIQITTIVSHVYRLWFVHGLVTLNEGLMQRKPTGCFYSRWTHVFAFLSKTVSPSYQMFVPQGRLFFISCPLPLSSRKNDAGERFV